jgi:predicted RNase H-like HicB family nuclease
MKRFTVLYERDETNWWMARVVGVRGCHTQGRTIEEARRRIREALGLYVEDADGAELIDDIRLPREISRRLGAYRSARTRAAKEQERARSEAKGAVRLLTKKMRLSVRDAGTLLGLSHQRVQQLLHG